MDFLIKLVMWAALTFAVQFVCIALYGVYESALGRINADSSTRGTSATSLNTASTKCSLRTRPWPPDHSLRPHLAICGTQRHQTLEYLGRK